MIRNFWALKVRTSHLACVLHRVRIRNPNFIEFENRAKGVPFTFWSISHQPSNPEITRRALHFCRFRHFCPKSSFARIPGFKRFTFEVKFSTFLDRINFANFDWRFSPISGARLGYLQCLLTFRGVSTPSNTLHTACALCVPAPNGRQSEVYRTIAEDLQVHPAADLFLAILGQACVFTLHASILAAA